MAKKKKKIKLGKSIKTSNWNVQLLPVTKSKIVRRKIKPPFSLNKNFIKDKERLHKYFDINKTTMPIYFIKLSNNLKNKNCVQDVFNYARLYLKGMKIQAIEELQKVPKKIKTITPTARIVKK